jgi:hypothetical protein
MYRTPNVARLAGALSLPVFLVLGGLLSLVVVGETTATTWELGLASMVPLSALFLVATQYRSPPRAGTQYAVGLVGCVVAVSVAYVTGALVDYATVRSLAGFAPIELLAAGSAFALLGGALALVDVFYVERPDTATVLEERYLDDPL